MVDYQLLEQRAEEKKRSSIKEGLNISLELFDSHLIKIQELKFLYEIDKFISVSEEKLEAATSFYEDISQKLSQLLYIPEKNIKIYPQGSASTKTIIRSATNEDFDIDAVSEISNYMPSSPMDFFDSIGKGLKKIENSNKYIEIEKKKRCWRVNLKHSGFYIDLIPGVKSLPTSFLSESAKVINYIDDYANDAIYIVNTPTEEWQSSNPKGFTKWLLEQNKYSTQLIDQPSTSLKYDLFESQVENVPDQEINPDDYLLLTIRLLKRHRDMMVKTNKISSDYKPISVILCTLIGQATRAMVDNGRSYQSYYQFLEDLVFKLPYMISKDEQNNPLIPNPTAKNENFADRWPEDYGMRKKAFQTWHSDINKTLQKVVIAPLEEGFDLLTEAFGTSGLKFDAKNETISFIDQNSNLTDQRPLTANVTVPDDGLA